MDNPQGNKIPQDDIKDITKRKAKIIEEHIEQANWKLLLKTYFIGLGIFIITLFLILFIIDLSFSIL